MKTYNFTARHKLSRTRLVKNDQAASRNNAFLTLVFLPNPSSRLCQVDRLAQLVEHHLKRDPYAGDVLVFLGRDRRRVKLL
jgi:hypothetical protein